MSLVVPFSEVWWQGTEALWVTQPFASVGENRGHHPLRPPRLAGNWRLLRSPVPAQSGICILNVVCNVSTGANDYKLLMVVKS